MSKVIPLTRRTVSAHLIFPSKDQVQSDVVDLITEEPAFLPDQRVPAGTKSHGRWLGILGLVVVAAILGLSVYSIAKYLL